MQLIGTLLLSGQSRIQGRIANEGVVRYELPAPLGTYVPGGGCLLYTSPSPRDS